MQKYTTTACGCDAVDEHYGVGYTAVSYTHLDVYKRQAWRPFGPIRQSICCRDIRLRSMAMKRSGKSWGILRTLLSTYCLRR